VPRLNRAAPPWRVVAAYVTSNVRQLREEAGWTQAEAAEHAGLDLKHYQQVEGTRMNLTLQTLVALAHGFGVDVHRLIDPAPKPMRRPRGRPRRAR
jgi:transcriptional regulator with XRE-family HTH domain